MKPGTLTHTIAVILSSVSSLFTPSAPAAVPGTTVKLSRKSSKPQDDNLLKIDPIAFSPAAKADPPLVKPAERFHWKKEIVTTVFWIGEKPTSNNPVPNRSSSWDANWTKNYGGVDEHAKTPRSALIPPRR